MISNTEKKERIFTIAVVGQDITNSTLWRTLLSKGLVIYDKETDTKSPFLATIKTNDGIYKVLIEFVLDPPLNYKDALIFVNPIEEPNIELYRTLKTGSLIAVCTNLRQSHRRNQYYYIKDSEIELETVYLLLCDFFDVM